MKRKPRPIVLEKLGCDARAGLDAMVMELTENRARPQLSKWGRRFAASGKAGAAPSTR